PPTGREEGPGHGRAVRSVIVLEPGGRDPARDLMPLPFGRRNAPALVSLDIRPIDHDRRPAMGSWSLPLLLMALAGASPPERPSDDNPPERQAHQAVQRGIGFLEKEGLAWMKKQQCASCHHIPLMVWALNEARGRGFQVDEKALG